MGARKKSHRCKTGVRRKRQRVWPYCGEHLIEFGVPAPSDERCAVTPLGLEPREERNPLPQASA
jgi:hypothetical protein